MRLTIRHGAKEYQIEVADVDGTSDDNQNAKQQNETEEEERKKVEIEQNSTEKRTNGENEEENDGACETTTTTPPNSSEKMARNLGELREQICAETGYDNSTMKLIHKGKYIVAPLDRLLAQLNLKEGDKIIAMGSGAATSSKLSAGVALLANYERTHLVKLSELFKTNGDDIAELERNFLEGEQLDEMLKRMDKRLKEFTEKALRHLESIDALHIYSDGATEEEKCRCREKRKCMVDNIQKLLNENDKYTFQLQQYRKSLLYK